MADRLLSKTTNIPDDTGAVCMDGVSGDSQTVLSISVCNTSTSVDNTIDILHTAHGGGSGVYIYLNQSLPAAATFIHNDKIVVDDTNEIWVIADGSADLDVIVTYLQQDD